MSMATKTVREVLGCGAVVGLLDCMRWTTAEERL